MFYHSRGFNGVDKTQHLNLNLVVWVVVLVMEGLLLIDYNPAILTHVIMERVYKVALVRVKS